MDTGLKGKVVLITGASRNMGRLAAIAFAKEGAHLALCTSAKMKELNAVADEARAYGVKVVAEQCDVAEPASVAAFVAKVEKELGTVHVVLNNAVYRGGEGAFLEDSDEAWERSFRVNLGGPPNMKSLPIASAPAPSRSSAMRFKSPRACVRNSRSAAWASRRKWCR